MRVVGVVNEYSEITFSIVLQCLSGDSFWITDFLQIHNKPVSTNPKYHPCTVSRNREDSTFRASHSA